MDGICECECPSGGRHSLSLPLALFLYFYLSFFLLFALCRFSRYKRARLIHLTLQRIRHHIMNGGPREYPRGHGVCVLYRITCTNALPSSLMIHRNRSYAVCRFVLLSLLFLLAMPFVSKLGRPMNLRLIDNGSTHVAGDRPRRRQSNVNDNQFPIGRKSQ